MARIFEKKKYRLYVSSDSLYNFYLKNVSFLEEMSEISSKMYMHRESNLITVQQYATVFSLLYSCRQLYMFRALTPIISSSYNCNYSF